MVREYAEGWNDGLKAVAKKFNNSKSKYIETEILARWLNNLRKR
jgi:hypothetical protein